MTESRPPRLGSRLRHWAIIRFLVYVIALVLTVVISAILGKTLIPPGPSPLHHSLNLVRNLVSAAALLGVYALAVRLMERRRASELDPRKGALLLLVGAVIGLGLMSAVYGVMGAVHVARFSSGTGLTGLSGGLAAAFAAAVTEELLLRAVLFRIVEQVSGTTIGVLVSAAVFGLLHAANPGATAMSAIAIALEAGVLLALAYALTRNLWFAIGIHFAWNFTEGSLFGARVSGTAETYAFVRSALSGPSWLTGGAFGPEASVVSVGVCLFAALLIGALAARRGEWQSVGFTPSLA